MIDAYVLRDPQGRVMGISTSGYSHALYDAYENDCGTWPAYKLQSDFKKKGAAEVNGYTLRKERVAL